MLFRGIWATEVLVSWELGLLFEEISHQKHVAPLCELSHPSSDTLTPVFQNHRRPPTLGCLLATSASHWVSVPLPTLGEVRPSQVPPGPRQGSTGRKGSPAWVRRKWGG